MANTRHFATEANCISIAKYSVSFPYSELGEWGRMKQEGVESQTHYSRRTFVGKVEHTEKASSCACVAGGYDVCMVWRYLCMIEMKHRQVGL